MQPCSHCGQANREGTVYCEHCGVGLFPSPLITRMLDTTKQPTGVAELGPEYVIVLHVGEAGTAIAVQVHHEVILGRVTGHDDATTLINLEPYDADECGVSRRHARLLRDRQALYLMDLNSTNGTRLNNEPLPSAVERRLRDGDQIMLGRLRIGVYFQV